MKKILVIDDEVDMPATVRMILERKNFIVITLSKWQEITASVKQFEPDLVLPDI